MAARWVKRTYAEKILRTVDLVIFWLAASACRNTVAPRWRLNT
jgi:hypothetical protein